MPLDGMFLCAIKNEIISDAIGARVDKIHQPMRDVVVISMHESGRNLKLLISANASGARVGFSSVAFENPASPPMFCMLLRKHIRSGRLIGARQQGLDRVLYLDFESVSEMGSKNQLTLVCELIPRRANCILINQNNVIIDALKRTNPLESNDRIIFPGVEYNPLPEQDKLNILEVENEQIISKIINNASGLPDKDLMGAVQGLSPLISRELLHIYETNCEETLNAQKLGFMLNNLREGLSNPDYVILFDGEIPKDFSFMNITQYGNSLGIKRYDSASGLMEEFYSQRDEKERRRQSAGELLRFIKLRIERCSRKLESQKLEYKQSKKRDAQKFCGDLINANLNNIKKGQTTVRLVNYYDNTLPEIEIKLDAKLTPSQNAQKYYTEYKKAVNAERTLAELIEQGKSELEYLESVHDAASRAQERAEIDEIREELAAAGYIRKTKGNLKGRPKSKPLDYLRFKSPDGFTILCGRNNTQNDRLLRQAKPFDIWCHAKNMPGSHVVVMTEGKSVPDETIGTALRIAAFHSKGRESSSVPVDYTLIKNVKKPSGAKAGYVIFTHQKTVTVSPKIT